MEYDPKDSDIVNLLIKLRETNGAYPQEMLALRRQGYLEQIAEISAGAGLAVGLKNAVKGGKGAALPPAAGTAVEILLIVAILAEAGAVSYFYRGKLADLYRSFTNQPQVGEVYTPPVASSPITEIQVTPTSTIPVATKTETPPSRTPSLEVAANPTKQGGGNGSNSQPGSMPGSIPGSIPGSVPGSIPGSVPGSTAVSTPDPRGNNGNQYGLTPKPDRTKEPGNEISEENLGNNTGSSTKPGPKKKK